MTHEPRKDRRNFLMGLAASVAAGALPAPAAPMRAHRPAARGGAPTVQEVIDLVAFLRSLKPPPGGRGGHRGH